MPSLTIAYAGGQPLVRAEIKLSRAYANALAGANRPVPQPIGGPFLIDTGAEDTYADTALIVQLNLRRTGQVPVRTGLSAGIPHMRECFDAGIEIVGPAGTGFRHAEPNLPIIAADFRGYGFLGIIGRDVLARLRAVFDGPSQQVTLSY